MHVSTHDGIPADTIVHGDANFVSLFLPRCKGNQERFGWMGAPSAELMNFHLFLAGQEVGEALDLIEGGWKAHKKNPRAPNITEFLYEVADVFVYFTNTVVFSLDHTRENSFVEIDATLDKATASKAPAPKAIAHGNGAEWERFAAEHLAVAQDYFTLGRLSQGKAKFDFAVRAIESAFTAAGAVCREAYPGHNESDVIRAYIFRKLGVVTERQESGY